MVYTDLCHVIGLDERPQHIETDPLMRPGPGRDVVAGLVVERPRCATEPVVGADGLTGGERVIGAHLGGVLGSLNRGRDAGAEPLRYEGSEAHALPPREVSRGRLG